MGTDSRALGVALEAARKAGIAALRGFHGRFRVEYKKDSSPVTAVDRACEEIIRRTITRAFPRDGFMGEEYGGTGNGAEAFWVIDPIDGTKNFIRGIPFWGSLIARVVRGKLALGVLDMPATGETLWAERGRGAWLGRKRIHVSRISSLGRAFITHGSLRNFVRDGDARKLERIAAKSATARSFGDCGAYALVARGMTDAMMERGVSPWDSAAPKIIIEEAGGRFTDWSGRDDWRSPTALATNGLVHRAILGILKR